MQENSYTHKIVACKQFTKLHIRCIFICYVFFPAVPEPVTVVPGLKVVGPSSVEESQCYIQLCVSVNLTTNVPISVMYAITDGSAILGVGKL